MPQGLPQADSGLLHGQDILFLVDVENNAKHLREPKQTYQGRNRIDSAGKILDTKSQPLSSYQGIQTNHT